MNSPKSKSGLLIQQKDNNILFVDANINNNEPKFKIPTNQWKMAQENVINRGINGLDGISGISIAIASDFIELKQGDEIKLELSADNVEAFCEAMSKGEFTIKNIPDDFTSFE